MNIKITGIGYYLPPEVQTSKQLSKLINKSEEWIISRTGILERRISKIDVDEMGAEAAKNALNSASREPDLILNASGVPKQTIPDTSVFIQKKLGLSGIPSFSIHATCLSFIIALKTAACFIEQNVYKRILIVSSDRGTRGRNLNQPESASLLGDAAAAILLEKSTENDPSKFLYSNMKTIPNAASLTEVRGGGTNKHPQDNDTTDEDNLFSMNGPQIYKIARLEVSKMISDDLKKNNIKRKEIKLLIPHQASGMAVKAYSKYGKFSENQVINIISNTGNCVSASIPLALAMAHENRQFDRGDLLYFIGTGAGLSIASAIIKY